MNSSRILRDTQALIKLIRERREICGHSHCSVRIADGKDGPEITECVEVERLPGYSAACCNGPDCPQCR